MMITRQQQYDRALAIVERAGLQVVGSGMAKDGRRVYAVPSRTVANLWHLIVVAYGALQCDCQAGQHGKYCCHRAAVRVRLEREASAARERELEASLRGAVRQLAEAT